MMKATRSVLDMMGIVKRLLSKSFATDCEMPFLIAWTKLVLTFQAAIKQTMKRIHRSMKATPALSGK